VLPILPLYARSFGVGYGEAGLLISAYAVTRLGADLASGFVVDRFGERHTAAVGLMLVSLSALATGLAQSYAVAVGCWAGAGLGSALVLAAMFSYLLRVVPTERMARTLSVFYASFNVGIVAGGFAAGVIAHRLGIETPLFFLAGTSLVAAALYLRLLPGGGAGRALPKRHVEPPPLTTSEAILEREVAAPRHGGFRLLETLRRRPRSQPSGSSAISASHSARSQPGSPRRQSGSGVRSRSSRLRRSSRWQWCCAVRRPCAG
jgi:MFS family permease